MKLKSIFVFLLLMALPVLGIAVENPTWGLHFKAGTYYDAGVTLNLSKKTMLRTTFGFNSNHQEIVYYSNPDSESIDYTRNTHDLEVSVGLFRHIMKKENLSLYTGLEVGLGQSITKQNYLPQDAIHYDGNLKDKALFLHGNAILGIQHKISPQLAVFGELSFGFERHTEDDENFESMSWTLKRSGVGLIFYI